MGHTYYDTGVGGPWRVVSACLVHFNSSYQKEAFKLNKDVPRGLWKQLTGTRRPERLQLQWLLKQKPRCGMSLGYQHSPKPEVWLSFYQSIYLPTLTYGHEILGSSQKNDIVNTSCGEGRLDCLHSWTPP